MLYQTELRSRSEERRECRRLPLALQALFFQVFTLFMRAAGFDCGIDQ